MTGSKSDARSARAWALAGKQHGLLTRKELLALGFSSKAIQHRIAKGRLHPLGWGVYAVGWPQLTPQRRWTAAILSCGEGAVLSHRSAAAMWGIGKERPGRIDISVRRRCQYRRPGMHVRSRPRLPKADIAMLNGIPVTSPARTLLDMATELDDRALERSVNEADKRDLIDPETLRTVLEGHVGEPGVRRLRKLLDRHTFRLSDAELEVLFRPIAKKAGLPLPLTKQIVNGFEVDFYWPELGLVVETDGLRYHRTPATQAGDSLRDQTHVAAGLLSLRFAHYQVRYEPARVRGVLSKTAARLRRSPAGAVAYAVNTKPQPAGTAPLRKLSPQ